jgi:N-carbamoyl-L-amino-acid hydrolase
MRSPRSRWAAITIRSLDTQPTGGKFDGVLGVLAAVEALRTIIGYETYARIEVINWTNEAGSRFAPPLIASGVFAGVFDSGSGAPAEGTHGITFGEALQSIGYLGSELCGAHLANGASKRATEPSEC